METKADLTRDLALFLRWACKPQYSFKHDALVGPSIRTINNVLPPMHDVSVQTVVLKTGLSVGAVEGAQRIKK